MSLGKPLIIVVKVALVGVSHVWPCFSSSMLLLGVPCVVWFVLVMVMSTDVLVVTLDLAGF